MRLWANRRKSRDDEKPRHGSGRRGSYRRSDALEKRRKLMDAWSAYCGPKTSANIVQLRNFLGETVTRSANAKP